MLTAFARAFRTPDLRKQAAVHHRHHGDLPARLVHADARGGLPDRADVHLPTANAHAACSAWSTCSAAARCSSCRSSRSGSCRTSRRASSCSCSRWSSRGSRTLKKEGQSGTAKLTQYTRYLTIGLAVLQSTTLITLARNPQTCSASSAPTRRPQRPRRPTILIMVLTMTAGTGVIMWLGELITDRGIGNGMSLLIFTPIAARFPTSLWSIKTSKDSWAIFLLVIAVGIVVIGAGRLRRAVPAPRPGAVRQADGRPQDVRRHHDVHPAQGQHGRRHPGHLRLVAALPAGAADPVPGQTHPPGWAKWVQINLVRGDHPVYMISYFVADRLLHATSTSRSRSTRTRSRTT